VENGGTLNPIDDMRAQIRLRLQNLSA